MLKQLTLLISTIVGIVLSISVISNIGILNIIKTYLEANWIWLLPYLIVSFLIICCFVLRLQIILQAHGHRVPFIRLLFIHFSGFAVGYLSPVPLSGGEGVRALLLNKERIPYQEAFSSVIIDKSISEAMNVLFSIVGIIILIFHLSLPRNTVITVLFGIIIVASILILFYYQMIKGKRFFSVAFRVFQLFHRKFFNQNEHKLIETDRKISKFFRHHKKEFISALLLSLVSWVFMFAEYKLLLLTFGYNASITLLFMVIAVVAIAYMVPIPAALGVLEGGQASLFRFTNMRSHDGVAISIIIRSRDIISTFIGLLYMFNYGMSFKKKR